MNTNHLFDPDHRSKAPLAFVICLTVLIAAVLMASLTRRSFWKVSVSNVTYTNFNGISIRPKLLKPLNAASTQPASGILYIHGYQNNREGGLTLYDLWLSYNILILIIPLILLLLLQYLPLLRTQRAGESNCGFPNAEGGVKRRLDRKKGQK